MTKNNPILTLDCVNQNIVQSTSLLIAEKYCLNVGINPKTLLQAITSYGACINGPVS